MGYGGTAIGGQAVTGIAYNGQTIRGIARGGQVVYEDSDGYVIDGLVARHVASRNQGDHFDPAALTWRDLVGNADLVLTPSSLTTARKWGANYFDSQKTGAAWFTWLATLPPEFTPESCTIEQVMMPTADGDGSAGGDVWGINGKPAAPYISADNEMYGKNIRFYAPETSSYSQVGANQTLVLNQLYRVSSQIQPYNSGAGRKQMWIDGVKKIDVARTAAKLYITESPARLSVMGNGGDFRVATQVFYGRLYELRIYNRTLTPEEIAQNYARDVAVYGAG